MVSIGIFELVVLLNVLFVIESPTDGKPCDELECCWPCVVFSVHRPFLEPHIRFTALETCGPVRRRRKEKINKSFSTVFSTNGSQKIADSLPVADIRQQWKSERLAKHWSNPLHTRSSRRHFPMTKLQRSMTKRRQPMWCPSRWLWIESAILNGVSMFSNASRIVK